MTHENFDAVDRWWLRKGVDTGVIKGTPITVLVLIHRYTDAQIEDDS